MPHVTRHKHNACQAVSILLLFLWLSPTSALAHPEGFSGLHVTITADRMRVAITLHTRDLGTWFPPGKYPDYVADVTRDMEQTIGEIIELQIDEQPLPISSVKAFLLEVGLIEIDVDYKLPPSADTVELLVWSKHLIQMPRGHQQLLFIEDCREMAADAEHGVMRLEDVLTAERDAGAVLLLVMYDGVPRPSNKSPNPPPEDSTALEGHRTGEARQPKPRPDAATEHRS